MNGTISIPKIEAKITLRMASPCRVHDAFGLDILHGERAHLSATPDTTPSGGGVIDALINYFDDWSRSSR
jgi:hypothetical protein